MKLQHALAAGIAALALGFAPVAVPQADAAIENGGILALTNCGGDTLTTYAAGGTPVALIPDYKAALANSVPSVDTAEFKIMLDGQDVTEQWRLANYQNAFGEGNIGVIVPWDLEAGKTYTIAVEAEGFVSDFEIVALGFDKSEGKPGETVTLSPLGFPEGTTFGTGLVFVGNTEVQTELSPSKEEILVHIPETLQAGEQIDVRYSVNSPCDDIGFKEPVWSIVVGEEANGSSTEGGSSDNFDKSKLWWLALIPAGGLLAWGISKVIGGGEGSSVPGQPKPGQPEPEVPGESGTPEDQPVDDDSGLESETVSEQGAANAVDAPRQNITSVPSGATKLDAGIATYI